MSNPVISNGELNVLPRFHTRPINVVVYDGSMGITNFEVSFSFVFRYPALQLALLNFY